MTDRPPSERSPFSGAIAEQATPSLATIPSSRLGGRLGTVVRTPEWFEQWVIRQYRNINARTKSLGRESLTAAEFSSWARSKFEKWACQYCGTKLNSNAVVDHAMPLARGGTSRPENLTLSCLDCNHVKGTMSSDTFTAFLTATQHDPRIREEMLIGLREAAAQRRRHYVYRKAVQRLLRALRSIPDGDVDTLEDTDEVIKEIYAIRDDLSQWMH